MYFIIFLPLLLYISLNTHTHIHIFIHNCKAMIAPNKINNNPLGSSNSQSVIRFPLLPQKCLFTLRLVWWYLDLEKAPVRGVVSLPLKAFPI